MVYPTVILSDSEESKERPFAMLRVTLQKVIHKSVYNSG
jgi:hypothetical protein